MTFDWMKFDKTALLDFIEASDLPEKTRVLARENSDDKEYLVSKMNLICESPDEHFIMKYRPIIEQKILKYNRAQVSKICKALYISGMSHNERQVKMTRKATSAGLIRAYINALNDISGVETEINEYSKFKSTVAVNMPETQIEDVSLYDFQENAVSKLKNHFLSGNKESGILVMPTGSGKTRTATYFLIKEMVSKGYQVLWIAHRHMLIDQAADTFYRFAGLAKIENPNIRNYSISCISGQHMSIAQVGKDQVIVASIASICRNKTHLRRILGSKVIIVVDEAHHTFAPTYRDTIQFIKKARKDTKLLGLTATPIRANENDSKDLLRLFDNNIIFDVALSDLIAKGTLADPQFKEIRTRENFEPDITIDEEKFIRKYGEIPQTLVDKMARSNSRNEAIIKEYLDNRKTYGKTLIFALNVLHCKMLYEDLKEHGVKVGLVYSGKDDNTTQINMFKDGKLDVLVNVNIMTEGTDVPDIQTVFLTRPTSSEGFLMQMIGRGMRGKASGGTETVNIVDFYDQWDTIDIWLHPQWQLLNEKGAISEIPAAERKKIKYKYYEWSLCRELYKSIRYKVETLGYSIAVPVGWYTLIDEEGEPYRMLFFENQLEGLLNFFKDKSLWREDKNIEPGDIIKKYFGGFCLNPSERDIKLLMDNIRNLEDLPERHTIENRKSIDPYYVVKKSESEDTDIFEVGAKLFEDNEIVRDLYESKESYVLELCKAKIYKEKGEILGMKVEELPFELNTFDQRPKYDLDELVNEVKQQMFGGEFDGISSVEWTDKAYKQYFGKHYFADNSIKINRILNSESVERETVKFVIYHELLHRDYRQHDKEFRQKEHEFPGWEDCEHFLYSDMRKFDITEM